jgi:hypothetical protein
VWGVVPAAVLPAADVLVTVNGFRFSNGTDVQAVLLAGVNAAIVSATTSRVVVRAPAAATTMGPVVVRSVCKGDVFGSSFAYTNSALPILSSSIGFVF